MGLPEWTSTFVDYPQAWASAIAAAAAVAAVINGSRTLKRTREDSRARNRPMVTAELMTKPHMELVVFFRIRNLGPTVARDLVVTFDPPLPGTTDAQAEDMASFIKRRYADPIPVLVPGVEMVNTWQWGDLFDPKSGDCPSRCLVTLSYVAPDRTRYEERFPLDTSMWLNQTDVTSSSDPHSVAKKTLEAHNTSARNLSAIARSVQLIQKEAGRPTRTRQLLGRSRR